MSVVHAWQAESVHYVFQLHEVPHTVGSLDTVVPKKVGCLSLHTGQHPTNTLKYSLYTIHYNGLYENFGAGLNFDPNNINKSTTA